MEISDLKIAWEKEYVTMRYSAGKKFVWNEWRGLVPSPQLREAMLYACEFIVANDIELLLADFTKLSAPSLEDQAWIPNRAAALLQHSKLSRVANLMAQDIFQQIAIETIYDLAYNVPLPFESKNFISEGEALDWLFEK